MYTYLILNIMQMRTMSITVQMMPVVLTNLVVSARINHNRQEAVGVNLCTHSVQLKLSHRDPHSIAAQVTQAKNTFTICHHNGLQQICSHQTQKNREVNSSSHLLNLSIFSKIRLLKYGQPWPHLHMLLWPVSQQFFHMPFVMNAYKQSPAGWSKN